MFKIQKNNPNDKKKIAFPLFGSGDEKKYFAENLAMLLASGMGILSSLDAIAAEARSRRMKVIMENLRGEIDSGSPVWKALENTRLMPDYIISLIKIGEKTGRLSENLKIVATQQQKERSFRAKVASAMMYPVLVLSLTVFIGVGVAWFILPRLSTVFTQMRLDLPWITKALIATGNFLGHWGFYFVPAVIILFSLTIYFIFFYPKTKYVGQAILFNFPGTKRMVREIELARAGYLLGTLLQAGVPIVDSLNSLSDATVFRNYKKFYTAIRDGITEGNSFQKSFEFFPGNEQFIPASIKHMVVAGEQSGHLPETFLKIGQIFEEKTEITTKNFSVIIEPILLVIVWIGVVCVALAVILPIYSLIGGLNKETSPSTSPPPPNEQTLKSQVTPKVTEQIISEKNQELSQTNSPLPEVTQEKQMLEILETGTGFLNVRDNPSKQGKITGKVKPGETYQYTEEKNGWYNIVLPDDKNGWVLGDYVKKISNTQ